MSSSNRYLAVTVVTTTVGLASVARTNAFSAAAQRVLSMGTPTLKRASSSGAPTQLSTGGNENENGGESERLEYHFDSQEDKEPFIQDDLTREREMEDCPTHYDHSESTVAFDRPIDVLNIFGDNTKGMIKHLPVLFDECKQLENTANGKKFTAHRLAIFILGSNKLEGTLSPGASEGDTFQYLLKLMKSDSSATHLIPEEEEGSELVWEGDGDNETTEAWFRQCRSHLRALLMILDWAKAGEPLTSDKLLACHSELMRGAFSKISGAAFESRFRREDEPVCAGQCEFPTNSHHDESISAILDKLDSKFGTVHPVEWSCEFLLEILSEHPFLNGNGRMARLCCAYGLVRHGVPCAVVFSDWHSKARSHYYEAVKVAQGQKGQMKKAPLHTIGTVGLFATLQNMSTFCARSKS